MNFDEALKGIPEGNFSEIEIADYDRNYIDYDEDLDSIEAADKLARRFQENEDEE